MRAVQVSHALLHAHAAVQFRAHDDAKRLLSAGDSVITDSFLTMYFYFVSTLGLRHWRMFECAGNNDTTR